MKKNNTHEIVEAFVSRLSKVALPDVFNPYSDLCPHCDEPNAANVRRANLSNALTSALNLEVQTIWIARDLGYRGGRRTGLALTDEAHLSEHSRLLDGIQLQRATRGPLVKERTATVIWRMIMQINEPIFLWNAFPFHPHLEGEPMTNRCHTNGERKALDWALHELLRMLKPNQVFSIGGDARKCLDGMGVESTAFRHPSYGGQNQFIREVESAYGLSTEPTSDPSKQQQMTLL